MFQEHSLEKVFLILQLVTLLSEYIGQLVILCWHPKFFLYIIMIMALGVKETQSYLACFSTHHIPILNKCTFGYIFGYFHLLLVTIYIDLVNTHFKLSGIQWLIPMKEKVEEVNSLSLSPLYKPLGLIKLSWLLLQQCFLLAATEQSNGQNFFLPKTVGSSSFPKKFSPRHPVISYLAGRMVSRSITPGFLQFPIWL